MSAIRALNKLKLLHAGSTGLISLMMLFSAYAYFSAPEMLQAFQHLGFPDYFRVELGIAKILGVGMLWVPKGRAIREWAYAGFAITFISAGIAHLGVGDPLEKAVAPAVALGLLALSYGSWKKLSS